jgi:hypothetical protein
VISRLPTIQRTRTANRPSSHAVGIATVPCTVVESCNLGSLHWGPLGKRVAWSNVRVTMTQPAPARSKLANSGRSAIFSTNAAPVKDRTVRGFGRPDQLLVLPLVPEVHLDIQEEKRLPLRTLLRTPRFRRISRTATRAPVHARLGDDQPRHF